MEYAPNWKQRVRERRERVGNQCEQCGVPQRSIALNSKGEPYMIYLQGCHLNHDPQNPEADFRIWCPTCHNRYDAQHRQETRKATATVIKLRK
jgi:hypothetical protein